LDINIGNTELNKTMDDPLIGSVLGDYEVNERIGIGGMGIVYLGRQLSLDRSVAIKVLLSELCVDIEYVDRFLREARAAAHLNHPNVIQIFDAGVAEDIYFFVMEYVEGKNLTQILKDEGPFEEHKALEIIHRTAVGLAFAHEMGIIHRDVKPENIMLTPKGDVKIGDLGLAKWKSNKADAAITATGNTMGTPYYISPEQIRAMEQIDGRSDIYSLGMSLYHILSGKPAFFKGSSIEIMAQHLSDKVPSLEQINQNISPATVKLIESMIRKKREDRIQSMEAVVDEIAKILGLSPGRNFVRSHRSREKEEVQEGKLWNIAIYVIVATLIGLFLTIAGVVFLKHSRSEKKAATEVALLSNNVVQTEVTMPQEDVEAPPVIKTDSEPVKHSEPTNSKNQETPKTIAIVPNRQTSGGAFTGGKSPATSSKKSIVAHSDTPVAEKPKPAPSPQKPPAPQPTILKGLGDLVEATISSKVKAQTPIRFYWAGEGNINLKFSGSAREERIRIGGLAPRLLRELDLVASHTGANDCKFLIRLNTSHFDAPSLQTFASKIQNCSNATLEITPIKMSDDAHDLCLAVYRVCTPWGKNISTSYPPEVRENEAFVNDFSSYLGALEKETNWKWASESEKKTWWKEGASGTADYDISFQDSPNKSIKMTASSIDQPLKIDISTDLKQWADDIIRLRQSTKSYGWMIQVVSGSGEVRFASSRTGSKVKPRIILTQNGQTAGNKSDESNR
jgi:serine/threonine protein kinase